MSSDASDQSHTDCDSRDQIHARSGKKRIQYGLLNVPPWWQCVFLGAQQFLTMLGGTVLIPQLLVPAMGGTAKDVANVISTVFFSSGICTLVQVLAGARLPIIQGASFAYIPPALAIATTIKTTIQFDSDHERFLYTMRILQGGIIGSSVFIIAAGALGLVSLMMRYISPITIAANIAVLGLALYDSGFPVVGTCVQLGLVQIALLVAFVLFMSKVKVFGVAVFGLFPVILSLGITWLYAYIMTVAGVYDNSSPQTQQTCTTWPSNNGNVLGEAPWFRVPYPGQWGAPIMTTYGVFTMLAGVIPATLETLGDVFAAAQLSGVPPPPGDVLGRAVAVEGVCCCINGVLGTGTGSTAYAENIGAISLTGVASRRVIQTSAVMMIIAAVLGKFSALFASIPQAVMAGLFCVMFGLIVGVGLSYLRHIDLESMRNQLILGFSLYMGLSVPEYFAAYTEANGHGPVNTGSRDFNNVMNSIFSTAVAVTLIITLLLDNTAPGTERERGMHVWKEQQVPLAGQDWWEDDYLNQVYGWPFGLTRKWKAFRGWALSRLRDSIPAAVRRTFERVFHRNKGLLPEEQVVPPIRVEENGGQARLEGGLALEAVPRNGQNHDAELAEISLSPVTEKSGDLDL